MQTNPTPVPHHGRIVSIIGLIFAFIGLAVVGLILSIIGLVKSIRGGKADIIAILGLIFNVIGIFVTGIFVVLVLIAYNNVQMQARDSLRESDARTIANDASKYRASPANAYPALDQATFKSQIPTTTIADQIGSKTYDKISTIKPSASTPNNYMLSYCGGDTASTATGFRVDYWNEKENMISAVSTGTGCIDGAKSIDGLDSSSLQPGSEGAETPELFN